MFFTQMVCRIGSDDRVLEKAAGVAGDGRVGKLALAQADHGVENVPGSDV